MIAAMYLVLYAFHIVIGACVVNSYSVNVCVPVLRRKKECRQLMMCSVSNEQS